MPRPVSQHGAGSTDGEHFAGLRKARAFKAGTIVAAAAGAIFEHMSLIFGRKDPT
jgi:hypothetical protein